MLVKGQEQTSGENFRKILELQLLLGFWVTTQPIKSPHPLAPSPKGGEGEPN